MTFLFLQNKSRYALDNFLGKHSRVILTESIHWAWERMVNRHNLQSKGIVMGHDYNYSIYSYV